MARRSRRNACRRRSTSRAITDCRVRILICSRPGPISSSASSGDLILKIFPPMLRGQFVSERAVAGAAAAGGSASRFRKSCVEGERDGWPYLVITRLHGMLGTQAWPALPEDQKERVLGQIGETIAEVQQRPGRRTGRASSRAGTRFMRRADRGMPGAASCASDCRKNFSTGWTICLREAADADSDGRAAGDPDRRIHSGEFFAELADAGELAAVGADRFRRRDDRDGANTICSAPAPS